MEDEVVPPVEDDVVPPVDWVLAVDEVVPPANAVPPLPPYAPVLDPPEPPEPAGVATLSLGLQDAVPQMTMSAAVQTGA